MASYTGITEDGTKVTLLKRAPKLGEYGWWIGNEFTLEDGFNREFHKMYRAPLNGALGWRCNDTNFLLYDGLYLTTVITHD